MGTINGKRAVIQLPNAGSTFYNYKGTCKRILLAFCDTQYQFTLFDIGEAGHHGLMNIQSMANHWRMALSQFYQFKILVLLKQPVKHQALPYVVVGYTSIPW